MSVSAASDALSVPAVVGDSDSTAWAACDCDMVSGSDDRRYSMFAASARPVSGLTASFGFRLT